MLVAMSGSGMEHCGLPQPQFPFQTNTALPFHNSQYTSIHIIHSFITGEAGIAFRSVRVSVCVCVSLCFGLFAQKLKTT